MWTRTGGLWLGVCLLAATPATAQNVPIQQAQVQLGSYDARTAQAPANSTNTLLPFTVEGGQSSASYFHIITTNAAVVVTLVLPSGNEVNSANAASLGFTYTTIDPAVSDSQDFPSPLALPGYHTLIEMPAGQPGGTYSIRANASGVATESSILAMYHSGSDIGAAASPNASSYAVGDTVVLSGVVFDWFTPIPGASVSAAITAPRILDSQAVVGGFQLTGQEVVTENLTNYTYTATLTNSGAAVSTVWAEAVSLPAEATLLDDTLLFGDVAANSTVTSGNTITIQRNPSRPFDPQTLVWRVRAPGAPATIPLTDSGPQDAEPGDGIYTGVFTPVLPGDYSALVTFTGVTPGGISFSKTAVAGFRVAPQVLARFGTFTDSQDPGGVTVTANVNVQTAGKYVFSLDLQDSSQAKIHQATLAELTPGAQQMAVRFSNREMAQLTTDGPYQRLNATLIRQDLPGDWEADRRADAGSTGAYLLGDFKPPVYLTRELSAVGVVTGAGPKFDILRASIGIFSRTAGACVLYGTLTDAAGSHVNYTSARVAVPAGASSIPLDFNGLRVAQSAGPPFIAGPVMLSCEEGESSARRLGEITGLTPSQFNYVAPDFSLSQSGPVQAGAGKTIFPLQLVSNEAFLGTVEFGLSGLPSGAAGEFFTPSIANAGPNTLSVSAANLPSGTYPFSVTYTSGATTKSLALTLSEAVSLPAQPAGPGSAISGTLYQYSASGGASSYGHTVQYSFDWGDGSSSGWTPPGVTSSFHSWTAPGQYAVTVRARCVSDPTVISGPSPVLTIVVTGE